MLEPGPGMDKLLADNACMSANNRHQGKHSFCAITEGA